MEFALSEWSAQNGAHNAFSECNLSPIFNLRKFIQRENSNLHRIFLLIFQQFLAFNETIFSRAPFTFVFGRCNEQDVVDGRQESCFFNQRTNEELSMCAKYGSIEIRRAPKEDTNT